MASRLFLFTHLLQYNHTALPTVIYNHFMFIGFEQLWYIPYRFQQTNLMQNNTARPQDKQCCKEYYSLSYDAITAHVAILFTRYMILEVQKRDNEDELTLGELLYLAIDEMADISFSESMPILIEAMTNNMKEIIHADDNQLVRISELFLINLLVLWKQAYIA